MKRVGPHVSISGGVQNAPLNAKALGATAFGMFTKNQRRWDAKPLEPSTIDAFKTNMELNGYAPEVVLVHDSYLINVGNPDIQKRQQSTAALLDEVQRCASLGLTAINIHPGSHLGLIDEDACCGLIAQSINRILDKTSGVRIVLENTAGQGSNVGYRFEHLAYIIEKTEDKSRIGFCIDTCHAFAAGYEMRTAVTFQEMIKQIDTIIGLKYLRGAHLNDAKIDLGSHVDRHQSIGKGTLGVEPFRFIMREPAFDEIPLVLETIDESAWAQEIKLLYELGNSN